MGPVLWALVIFYMVCNGLLKESLTWGLGNFPHKLRSLLFEGYGYGLCGVWTVLGLMVGLRESLAPGVILVLVDESGI